MKLKDFLGLAALVLVSAPVVARGQEVTPPSPTSPHAPPVVAQAPEPPAPFATTFFDDGPFLGIHVEDVTRANISTYGLSGEPRGVGVRSVIKGSPAERAGLRERDVIVRFDGEEVGSVRKLTRLIGESVPDHAARITVLRGGAAQDLTATLAARNTGMQAIEGELMPGLDSAQALSLAENLNNSLQGRQLRDEEMRKRLGELQREHPGIISFGSGRRIGVTTSPLGKQLADFFGVSGGILINSVEANSPAEKAGLKAGDVITEAGGRRVEDAGDLVRALDERDEGELTLTVVRERKQRTVRVKPEARQSQGINVTPGAFGIAAAAPFAAAPRIVAPYLLNVPRAVVAPRVVTVPNVRMATPRVRVLGFGDRVL